MNPYLVVDVVGRIVKRGDRLAQLRRVGGPETAAEFINGRADSLQGEFRIIDGGMQDEEHRFLHERNATAEQRYRETEVALIVGSVLALLVVGASFVRARRDDRDRQGGVLVLPKVT